MAEKAKKFKRLFYDIEVSPNLVTSWGVGRKISLDYHSIVRERSVICVCWKWENEKTVYSLKWDRGDDKKLLKEFAKVMIEADELCGHNSIKFDESWIRTRCLFHGISLPPNFNNVDTLRLLRKSFKLNSNRLDYVSRFLGVGGKEHSAPDLWRLILLDNNKRAMEQMIKYCKNDVLILEKVFNKLNPFVTHNSHKGVALGGEPVDCPKCCSKNVISNGIRVMATGLKKRRMHCQSCGGYFSIAESVYELIKPRIEK